MSGIAGILNLDGAPVERASLDSMTRSLVFRGPDGLGTRLDGAVGLGHTLLATVEESRGERQPSTLDGRCWIIADARVDGREELTAKLAAAGCHDLGTATDAALILQAYQLWGDGCLDHLIGDFAFAIWDGPRHQLFCARDQFGVKPFYYALVGNSFIFSNTLNCVREHPTVSDALNDLAIVDFLLFDYNQEETTTTFSDIRRLPPAHRLICSEEGGVSRQRYWRLPTDGAIHYSHADDYVEHFRELLQTSVADRLRTNNVAVWMSGGLDSTAVAATAKNLLGSGAAPIDLRAYTVVYDRVIPDRERRFAGMVAEALQIPIHYQCGDDYAPFERWERPELHTPEPDNSPLAAIDVDLSSRMSAHARVSLTGYGGDPGLQSSASYFVDMLRRGEFRRLLIEAGRHLITRRDLTGLGFRTLFRRWREKRSWNTPVPGWLNEDLVGRFDLEQRLKSHDAQTMPQHPAHPEAYSDLASNYWAYRFENSDPGVTLFPIEHRHPLFDIRILEYMLAVPPVPWCLDKHLLREAMRGSLPDEVRLRPKTALPGTPELEMLRSAPGLGLQDFDPVPELATYIRKDRVPPVGEVEDDFWANLRPICLNYWLRNLRSIKHRPKQEVCYEVQG